MRRELTEPVVLTGRFVRLEPITLEHVPALAAAAGADRSTFEWTPVPDGADEFRANAEMVLAERERGRRLAFATIRLDGSSTGEVGATFEGILSTYRYGVEGTPRNTAAFAITARDWPGVRARLVAKLDS